MTINLAMVKGVIVVARRHICNTLYKAHVKMHVDSRNIVKREIYQNPWHQGLDHISKKCLSSLIKKEENHCC